MSRKPIIDAGPGLNFFSINKQGILIAVLGKLSAPEAVEEEVFRKAGQDNRFANAGSTWLKMKPNWIEVLSDEVTPELAAAVQRMTNQTMAERYLSSKDLGETMVIAHAVVAAEAGENMTVLIDDGAGARTAAAEARRLERLRLRGRQVGTLTLVSTLTVLEAAVGNPKLRKQKVLCNKGDMRTIYTRLRGLDDGLPAIESTDLLTTPRWNLP